LLSRGLGLSDGGADVRNELRPAILFRLGGDHRGGRLFDLSDDGQPRLFAGRDGGPLGFDGGGRGGHR
jgi:hypothetical protein